MKSKPKRLPIPEASMRAILKRQKGKCSRSGERIASIYHAEFNHVPALGVRPVLPDGSDYVPAQLDPRYIEAVLPKEHNVITNGPRVPGRRMLDPSYDKARIEKADRLSKAHQKHQAVMAAKAGKGAEMVESHTSNIQRQFR